MTAGYPASKKLKTSVSTPPAIQIAMTAVHLVAYDLLIKGQRANAGSQSGILPYNNISDILLFT